MQATQGTTKEKGRDGGLETPGVRTWMQMLSRWAKHGGSWIYSPRAETPGGSWVAAYVPDGTTGTDEMREMRQHKLQLHVLHFCFNKTSIITLAVPIFGIAFNTSKKLSFL
ncbi:hypothetical protein DPMN_090707 [Dreissena polymorpha]|uniref:Uncharacterized protein n=1 Tax=Dreissena polymorpha TaxID=45954 RepID=A0A9D4KY86_DREPO|nr:hypothetical protein DPMN_090707 [Dreissena polymorpha]